MSEFPEHLNGSNPLKLKEIFISKYHLCKTSEFLSLCRKLNMSISTIDMKNNCLNFDL